MREAIQIIQWASHTLKYLKLRLAGKRRDYGHTAMYTYAVQDLYTIPLANIDGGVSLGTTIYLMAHATIYYKGIRIGSAYGLSFKGSFNYITQEAPPITLILSIVKTGPLGLTQEGHIFIQ